MLLPRPASNCSFITIYFKRKSTTFYLEMLWLFPLIWRSLASLLLQGQLAAHTIAKGRPLHTLADAEFRVYSQWGEDGIIEWLVTQVTVPNNRFIEIGVENFTEANCHDRPRNCDRPRRIERRPELPFTHFQRYPSLHRL
jgi:hypothetical protein